MAKFQRIAEIQLHREDHGPVKKPLRNFGDAGRRLGLLESAKSNLKFCILVVTLNYDVIVVTQKG